MKLFSSRPKWPPFHPRINTLRPPSSTLDDAESRLTIAMQKARVLIERVVFPLFQVS
jgi:hypothetical protein